MRERKFRYRIREIKNTATGEKEYCIDHKNFLGFWYPDWSFYSPYFSTFEAAKERLIAYTGKREERIVYPTPTIPTEGTK